MPNCRYMKLANGDHVCLSIAYRCQNRVRPRKRQQRSRKRCRQKRGRQSQPKDGALDRCVRCRSPGSLDFNACLSGFPSRSPDFAGIEKTSGFSSQVLNSSRCFSQIAGGSHCSRRHNAAARPTAVPIMAVVCWTRTGAKATCVTLMLRPAMKRFRRAAGIVLTVLLALARWSRNNDTGSDTAGPACSGRGSSRSVSRNWDRRRQRTEFLAGKMPAVVRVRKVQIETPRRRHAATGTRLAGQISHPIQLRRDVAFLIRTAVLQVIPRAVIAKIVIANLFDLRDRVVVEPAFPVPTADRRSPRRLRPVGHGWCGPRPVPAGRGQPRGAACHQLDRKSRAALDAKGPADRTQVRLLGPRAGSIRNAKSVGIDVVARIPPFVP